ncbi:uncharacterized protein [Drosophila pseudoobscura]|uniref:Uncharacterized protein n=1 Tax=Drosophila pseudoobscura pseudoobscura TaxID=46245 RepID=A0A6I8UQF9_DROPS|nr:uncharacterized protein LOC4802310 [Drosophila pseudoobscura]
MGATSSQPRSAEIVNPNPFQVSREVVERLEQAREEMAKTSGESGSCEQCKKKILSVSGSGDAPSTLEHQAKEVPEVEPVDWPWKKRAVEMEESQFHESVKRVEELFGTPMKWTENIEGEIKQMEKELTTCYRENPYETLKCEPLAKRYHSFIFTNHFKAISKLQPKDSKPKSTRVPKDLVHIEAKQENMPAPLMD